MTSPPAPAVAPDRHQRMRDAARTLWLEHGYAISMDAVAKLAGCSKQTVYAHFGSKEGLFRLVVGDLVESIAANLDDGDGDLRARLLAFARSHADTLSETETTARRRLLIAEAQRFPREAAALLQGGAEAICARLARVFATAMARGEMRRDDPAAAAELFMGLCSGIELDRHLLGQPRRRTPQARRAWAVRAVDAFLRAYTPESPSPLSRTFS